MESADEAVDLLCHVRAHQPLVVAGQRVRTAVELLVEALDGVLGEDTLAEYVAVRAMEENAPVLRAGLFPLDGVDQLAATVEANVQGLIRLRGGGGAPARG